MVLPFFDVVALTVLAIGAAFLLVWYGDRLNRAALAWGVAHLALGVAALCGYRHQLDGGEALLVLAVLATVISLVTLWAGTRFMRGGEPGWPRMLGEMGALLCLIVFVSVSFGPFYGRLVVALLYVAVYASSAFLFLYRLRQPWVAAAFALEAMASLVKLFDWPDFSTQNQNSFLFVQQWVVHLILALVLIHAAVARSQRRLERIISHLPDAVMARKMDGTILYCNEAFARLAGGASPAQLVGSKAPVFSGVSEHGAAIRAEINAMACGGKMSAPVTLEREFHPAHGEPFPAEISFVNFLDFGYLSVIVQIRNVQERKRAEERIYDLAFFDQLTGLPNRRLLADRLLQAMTGSARSGSYGAVFCIDLDHFKVLNDTLGHAVGDRLLAEVGTRLQRAVREGDTVGRTGGDEFAIILGGLGARENDAASAARLVAEKCLRAIEEPSEIMHFERMGSASLGVVLFKGRGVAAEELIKQVEMSMYAAKAAGRNTVRFFDPQLETGVKERAVLELALRRAIQDGQLFNVYQPQVDGLRLVGAEALVRWQHPERGLISPAEFIPLAEETGLIVALGNRVLESACSQLVLWSSDPVTAGLTIAVNVSAQQFRQHYFVDQVLAALRKTGANPKRLKLELTESLLVDNVEEVVGKMAILKSRGVGFSLDDFGTGYSSLAYLKRLPIDQLKIDQSFVRDVLHDSNDASIIRTIVGLAHNLGLGVIAEGVETAAQRDFLVEAGCSACQGYFIGRPMPIDAFEAYVRQGEFAKT